LRREATQFIVEGSGDDRVDGVYSSKRGMEAASPELPLHGESSFSRKDATLYDGAPIYVQRCSTKSDDDTQAKDCDPYAIVHETIGQFGFWRIQRAATIGNNQAEILYLVLSEEVYPPDSGWRAFHQKYAPPPRVRPSVSSMYNNLKSYQQPDEPGDSFSDSRFFFFFLLITIGILLWTLVFFLIRVRFRVKFHSTTGLPLTSSS